MDVLPFQVLFALLIVALIVDLMVKRHTSSRRYFQLALISALAGIVSVLNLIDHGNRESGVFSIGIWGVGAGLCFATAFWVASMPLRNGKH